MSGRWARVGGVLTALLAALGWLAMAAGAACNPLMLAYTVYDGRGSGDIALYDLQTGLRFYLTRHPATDSHPVWSPDGTRLVFLSQRDGGQNLYMLDARGRHLQRLTYWETADIPLAWSPDGARILFASDRSFQRQFFTMNPEGRDIRSADLLPDWYDADVAWSPDGTRGLALRFEGGRSDIYLLDAGGQVLAQLTDTPVRDWQPAWSPDGRWIVFVSRREGRDTLYIMDAEGRHLRRLTAPGLREDLPAWRP